MPYRLIITEVTDYGTLHCVAGWDVNQKRMVRPEPAPASFWDPRYIGSNNPYWPGNIVEFDGTVPINQPFPHATEDVVVRVETLRKVDRVPAPEIAKRVSGSVAPELKKIFGNSLRFNRTSAYVPVGTRCASLGAIEIERASLKFAEQNWNGKRKLRGRCRLSGVSLDLGITATELRKMWMAEGLNALERNFSNNNKVHLRIGLSRPFDARPNECYVQINGIFPQT